MNLDEKIAGSIEAKLRELGLLFQDRDDACGDLGYLKDLHDQIPLLEDIKTEIKQLQDGISGQDEGQEDEPEDDPKHDPSPSDPELPDLRKRLRDWAKDADKAKRATKPLRKLLPSGEDPIPDWIKEVPWYDLISDIVHVYNMHKIKEQLDDKYGPLLQNLKDLIDNNTTFQEFWKNEQNYQYEGLERFIDEWNEDLEDKILRLFQIGENVGESLDTCCFNTTQSLGSLNDKTEEVHDQIDDLSDQLQTQNAWLDSSVQNALRGLV